jgi:NAD(P)-dependent dehydrogenase (short-subunit alcohol dehydrogenase family)
VRQYRAAGWLTIGTYRTEDQRPLLASVGATALQLDVCEDSSFANLTRVLDGTNIDVCVYNAGVFGSRTADVPNVDTFNAVMQTNVLGAMRAIPIVAPHLVKNKGAFAFISSKMGSISAITNGGAPLYRASKAALNAVVKAASHEYGAKGVRCFVMHPGWVKTDMGGAGADIDPTTSITGVRKVIASALKGDVADYNGKFFNYDGEEFSW